MEVSINERVFEGWASRGHDEDAVLKRHPPPMAVGPRDRDWCACLWWSCPRRHKSDPVAHDTVPIVLPHWLVIWHPSTLLLVTINKYAQVSPSPHPTNFDRVGWFSRAYLVGPQSKRQQRHTWLIAAWCLPLPFSPRNADKDDADSSKKGHKGKSSKKKSSSSSKPSSRDKKKKSRG